jgi:hypothetical protein
MNIRGCSMEVVSVNLIMLEVVEACVQVLSSSEIYTLKIAELEL